MRSPKAVNRSTKFTKENSSFMYGIAILMLVYHHLMCDPDRLKYPYITMLPQKASVTIAIFCHLCVGIYAFITGIGFAYKFAGYTCNIQGLCKRYVDSIKSILKFMSKYWIVFIPFAAFGLIFGIYSFSFKEFVLNLSGLSSTYNNEWWYVKQYVKMLVVLPLFSLIIDKFVEGGGGIKEQLLPQ